MFRALEHLQEAPKNADSEVGSGATSAPRDIGSEKSIDALIVAVKEERANSGCQGFICTFRDRHLC